MGLDSKTPTDRRLPNSVWSHAAVALLSVIITSAALAWLRFPQGYGMELALATPRPAAGTIYVGGAVVSPGYYTLRGGERIEDLLKAAGGVTDNASLDRLELYAPLPGARQEEQQVNINRAPAWLLQALPGIGESKAQAIITYRLRNGGFRSTSEITRVEGISAGIYDRIKPLITVSD